MNSYLDLMKPYWNERYADENIIWGKTPSNTAFHARKLFEEYGVKKVIIPGAGYGRNSKIFSDAGFDVTAVEISDTALNLAKINDIKTKFFCGSFLDVNIKKNSFDAVYCFNVLHLFREKERAKFVNKCYKEVKENGYVYFVVFSDKESSFGKGEEVEKNTFESKPGRPVHYFSEEDLAEQFSQFELIETGLIEDKENHGKEGPHTHKLRYIFCSKP